MATVKLVTLRIRTETMVPIEPTVHAHAADVIFDAWVGDAEEIRVPHPFADSFLPLPRRQVRTVQIVCVGPDGMAVFPSGCLG